jgi:D-arabinose 1-dehydrogenase-like Zn-dependent alcohol dehydrogenase
VSQDADLLHAAPFQQYAKAMGFRVAALSSSDKKRKLALELGATDYIVGGGDKGSQAEQLTERGGAALIVCTAPSSEVIHDLISGLAVNGTLLILAITPDDLAIPSMALIQKRLSVRGWPSGTAFDSEDTLKFAQLSGVKCQIERYPLEDAEEAYQEMMAGNTRFRAVLVPGYKKQ